MVVPSGFSAKGALPRQLVCEQQGTSLGTVLAALGPPVLAALCDVPAGGLGRVLDIARFCFWGPGCGCCDLEATCPLSAK